MLERQIWRDPVRTSGSSPALGIPDQPEGLGQGPTANRPSASLRLLLGSPLITEELALLLAIAVADYTAECLPLSS